jgi:hypothetical protein
MLSASVSFSVVDVEARWPIDSLAFLRGIIGNADVVYYTIQAVSKSPARHLEKLFP